MKRDITVYVASAWWRDSDPHTGVVALSADKAEDAIEDAIRTNAEDMASNDETCFYCDETITDENETEHVECAMNAQAWSGVFPESLREILANAGAEHRRRDILEDLRASGVAYIGS